jgi:hypothetical protein
MIFKLQLVCLEIPMFHDPTFHETDFALNRVRKAHGLEPYRAPSAMLQRAAVVALILLVVALVLFA